MEKSSEPKVVVTVIAVPISYPNNSCRCWPEK